jgi:hypothetical protein
LPPAQGYVGSSMVPFQADTASAALTLISGAASSKALHVKTRIDLKGSGQWLLMPSRRINGCKTASQLVTRLGVRQPRKITLRERNQRYHFSFISKDLRLAQWQWPGSCSPKSMESRWEPVSKWNLAGVGLAMAVFVGLVLYSEPGFVFLLDHANLLFHEAGHPIIGLFSSRLEPYGGTIGQLTFPLLLAISFWRKGQAIGVAAASVWFFENWLNIARYLGDARTMELPLVGGGDHDWNTILGRWHLLSYDTQIATGLKWVAWTGIALSCAWLGWRTWKSAAERQVRDGASYSRLVESTFRSE